MKQVIKQFHIVYMLISVLFLCIAIIINEWKNFIQIEVVSYILIWICILMTQMLNWIK